MLDINLKTIASLLFWSGVVGIIGFGSRFADVAIANRVGWYLMGVGVGIMSTLWLQRQTDV